VCVCVCVCVLQWCVTAAQVYRSPCPEEHMTGVPVHMDGSCNGLQASAMQHLHLSSIALNM